MKVCSAVSGLRWQVLATLAKAAMTMIAMITVPPKKAMFGRRLTRDGPKSVDPINSIQTLGTMQIPQ